MFNASGADVIVMAITSNLDVKLAGVKIDETSTEVGSIPAPSLILPCKVYSVAQSRIGKFFCRLKMEPFQRSVEMLQEAFRPLSEAGSASRALR